MATAAEAAFDTPSLSSVWRICLCRFDDSTTSSSTIPRVPVPWDLQDQGGKLTVGAGLTYASSG